MAIDLQKGQRIDVGLKHITVGLGWDPNVRGDEPFDLDASAFLLGENGKLVSDNHFIFYNNLDGLGHREPAECRRAAQGVLHTGDDPDGESSEEGDDEVIDVKFDNVPASVVEIVFLVTIHEAASRGQNFGQVDNSYIRIVDESTGTEIAKYELGEDFSIETAVEFGKLYRKNSDWKFQAIGDGRQEDLSYYVQKYR
jgi:tellurium resistance protein TerD